MSEAAARRLKDAVKAAKSSGSIADLPYKEVMMALQDDNPKFYGEFGTEFSQLLDADFDTLSELVEAMNDPSSNFEMAPGLRIEINNSLNIETITRAAKEFYREATGVNASVSAYATTSTSGSTGTRDSRNTRDSRKRSSSKGSSGSSGGKGFYDDGGASDGSRGRSRSGSSGGRGRSASSGSKGGSRGRSRSGSGSGKKSKKSKKRGIKFPKHVKSGPPAITTLAGYLYYLHWKRGQKIWSRRWFTFEEGEVRMYKAKGSKKFRSFPCLGAKVRVDPLGKEDPKHALQFYLKLDEGGLTKIYFRAASLEELRTWIYGLREVTGDNFGPDPFKCRDKYGKYTYDGKVFSEDNLSLSPSLMDDAVPWFAKLGIVADHYLSARFGRWGAFMVRHTIPVIVISAFLAGLFTAGWVFQYSEFAPIKVWVPQDSVAKLHDKIVKDNFPSSPRSNTLILRPAGTSLDDDDDILTSEYITGVYALHNLIMSYQIDHNGETYDYDSLCFRAVNDDCLNITIFEFWNDDPAAITADLGSTAAIKEQLSDTHTTYQGKPLDVDSYVGGIQRDQLQNVVSATAIRHSYFLSSTLYTEDEFRNENGMIPAVAWEFEFLDVLTEEGAPHTQLFRIERNAGVTVNVELGKAMSDSMVLLFFGIAAMITFVMLTLGQRDRVYGRMALGLSGIGDTMSSVGISNGFGAVLGIPSTPPVSVVPFIVLGIGVDDMFILVDTYDRTSPAKSLEGRFRQNLMESGIAILTTSMTDFLAFVIGAGTELPAIESFCWYAGFAVMGDFLMQITFFSAMMIMDSRRQMANRLDLAPCIVSKRPPSDNHLEENLGDSWLATRYGPFLMTPCVKIVVCGLFFGLFLFFVNGALQLEQQFKTEDLAGDDSYFQTFIAENDKYYPDAELGFSVNWYFNPGSDYKARATHVDIDDFGKKTRQLAFMRDAEPDMWHIAYIQYLAFPDPGSGPEHSHDTETVDDYPPNGRAFIDWLDGYNQPNPEFFQRPRGALYPAKIVQYAPGEAVPEGYVDRDILMCYITSTAIDIYDSQDQVEAMSINREFADLHPMDAFPFTGIYVINEQFAVIMQEAINNVVIALVVVFAVTIIMLIDPRAALLTTGVIFIVDMDLLGWTFYNGLTITGLTTTNIVIAIGLAVDYAVHVAHGFMSAGGNRNQRSIRAIATMGASVVSGAFSTWIAISPLTFAKSSIFRTFFTMFGGTLILGTSHGMILLPVLMSWYGPPAVPHLHDDEEEHEFEHMAAVNEQVNFNDNTRAADRRKTQMRMTMGFVL